MFHLAGSAVLAAYTMNLTHRTVKSIMGPIPSTLDEKDVSKNDALKIRSVWVFN